MISPGQIQSVSVNKNLRGNGVGTFAIQLAPGGPDGVEAPVVWTEIITPMSFVVIGMARGIEAAIPMVGVVTSIGESQAWRTDQHGGSSASRGIVISGADFGWFFSTFNWYALSFRGLMAGTPVGNALDFVPGSLATKLSEGLIGGSGTASSNPTMVGKAWYEIMAGPDGILNKTYVPYQAGSRLMFSELVGRLWENYPDVYIPYADFFMTSEESWTEKFQNIFVFPWYEFFVTTAPAGAYKLAGAGSTDAGKALSMSSLPAALPAGPQLVARVNPVPTLSISGTTISDIDATHWNALPVRDFTKSGFGFFRSSVSFSADNARNFYQLNPTGYSTITTNNTNNIPFAFQFIAAGDPASVQRYGFRPQIGTTRWLFDPQGLAAQNPGTKVQDTIMALTGRMIGWYHPVPLMASATVTIPLSPQILIGTRFRYAPFKRGEPWDFYIEGVVHNYEFGEGSSTQLLLTRGLPTAVYADTTLLQAIHAGNAIRKNGKYTVGLPPGASLPLQVVTTTAQAADLAGNMATVFVTPQSGAA